MKHARTQIFNYTQSLLTAVAEKVEVQTPYDVERKHKSHIDIHYTNDVVNLERKTMDSDAHDLSMVIAVTVNGYALTSAAPLADDIALAVELALSGEKTDVSGNTVRDGVHVIAGASVDIDLDDSSIEQEVDQEASVAKLYMNYSVFYRNEPGNPALLV